MTVVWSQKSPRIPPKWHDFIDFFFKSAVAPVRVRPAQKTQHARTSHAQFHRGFAPVRTPDYARTRATARTHARTLKLWLFWYIYRSFKNKFAFQNGTPCISSMYIFQRKDMKEVLRYLHSLYLIWLHWRRIFPEVSYFSIPVISRVFDTKTKTKNNQF